MLEEDDVIVWVEERLDSISYLDGKLCGIREKLWTVNQSSFLRLLVFKRKFERR